MILADQHQGLVPTFRVRHRDGQGRGKIEGSEGVNRVPISANGHLVIDVIVLPVVIELAEAVHGLDVSLHLKVGLGTDVVVGGDLNEVLRAWADARAKTAIPVINKAFRVRCKVDCVFISDSPLINVCSI